MSGRRFTPEEQALIVKMHADGASVAEIAKRVNACHRSVAWRLDIGGERARAAQRARKSKLGGVLIPPRQAGMISRRVPREPAKTLSPAEARMAAARAFAAGEIDRAELSLRLRNV